MLKSINKFLGLYKPPTSERITILVIGPPSCGKTALIYFLLRFASMRLRPTEMTASNWYKYPEQEAKDTPKPINSLDGGQGGILSSPNTSTIQQTGGIRVIGWPDFSKNIREETITGKNISSTEKSRIDLINFRSSSLVIDVYNIAGEVFRPAATGDFYLVQELGKHLEEKADDKIFTLLCNESKSVNAGVDIGTVLNFLDQSPTAEKVFNKMAAGIDTMRVVTKFDLIHEIERKPENTSDQKPEYYFQLIQEPISKLYAIGQDFITNHLQSYQDIKDHTFKGSGGKVYRKNLICTGMYDRVKSRNNKIYNDESVNGVPVSVLNECFRGDNLKDLSMFGIKEIFAVMLGKSPVFENTEILKFPSGSNTPKNGHISSADYKKILDNQIPRKK